MTQKVDPVTAKLRALGRSLKNIVKENTRRSRRRS